MTSTVIATRGRRLALTSCSLLGRRQAAEAFVTEVLNIVEIDADERIVGDVSCSTPTTSTPPSRNSTPGTSPAKRPPTRARGRSSPRNYAAVNRQRDSRDDARLGKHRPPPSAAIAPGDLIAYSVPRGTSRRASIYIEAVHRLTDLGAVVTHVATWDLARGLRRRVADHRPLDGRRRPDQPLREYSTRQTSTPRSRGSTSSAAGHRGWKTRQAR